MTEIAGLLQGSDGEALAWRKVEGDGPTVVWLGGFHSDMTGTKAEALAELSVNQGRSFLRFDYLGHGQSSGDFRTGTISRWREDCLAAIDQMTEGPLVLVGSSMGGWLACLVALARPERIKALILIAPAADFTEALLKPELSPDAMAAIESVGEWIKPTEHGGDGYPITRLLLEDGRRWSILQGPVEITVPVRILQGGQDPDVPWSHALKLAQALTSQNLVFSLIKDGDHRLSRPEDITRLILALQEVCDL